MLTVTCWKTNGSVCRLFVVDLSYKGKGKLISPITCENFVIFASVFILHCKYVEKSLQSGVLDGGSGLQ